MSEKARTLKNAGYLYARTVITTLIGIYTARIVIQTLGIEDYGIYGVTGSVVALHATRRRKLLPAIGGKRRV